jgi:Hpr(Ser) kinase/phosphatase
LKGEGRDITIADIISFKGEYLGLSLPSNYTFDIGAKIDNPRVIILERLPESMDEYNINPDTIILLSTKDHPYDIQRAIDEILKWGKPAAIVIELPRFDPSSCLRFDAHDIPVLYTTLEIPVFYKRLVESIEVLRRPYINMHGVLLDVHGLGVILKGKSGIGKSECALELITRGHRLVCDDMIIVTRRSDNTLIGYGSDIIKYHMEIRGLGIINVKDLFGISTIRDSKKIELIIELVEWEKDKQYDRLGIEDKTINILGIEVPYIILPVRSNRNIATIVEVAARNQLLKLKGFHSARTFQKNILDIIAKMGNIERIKEKKD